MTARNEVLVSFRRFNTYEEAFSEASHIVPGYSVGHLTRGIQIVRDKYGYRLMARKDPKDRVWFEAQVERQRTAPAGLIDDELDEDDLAAGE